MIQVRFAEQSVAKVACSSTIMSGSELKGGYGNLPEHVIIIIYSWLDISDRFSASLTCKRWAEAFHHPALWRHFSFVFRSKAHTRQLKCLDRHCIHLKSARIYVDPQIPVNVENVCKVVTSLARSKERRLERIGVLFTAENPMFFQGNDILSSLAELFGPPDPNLSVMSQLIEVDLSGLNVAFTDIILNLLSSNHPNLEILNIQNTSLICKISPPGLLNFVQKCRKLKKLLCFHLSTSNEMMVAFTEKDRVPIRYLSFLCQRYDKFHPPISGDVWNKVVKALPNLRVALLFDHTIERDAIGDILHHQIPVVELSLRTMCELEKEMALVDSYYSDTIEKLIITTKGSDELQNLLLSFVEKASKLRVLHCYCGLKEETIQKILNMKPFLEQCTLKTEETFRAYTPKTYVGADARATVMDSRNYPALEEYMASLEIS